MIIVISKLKVKYKNSFLKIKRHPYYISLLTKDYTLYEKSITYKGSAQTHKKTAELDNLYLLAEQIKKNGFNVNLSPIEIIKRAVHHGRHRICILYYLYGKKLKLKINKYGKITNIYYP